MMTTSDIEKATPKPTNEEHETVTHKDLMQIFWRSFTLEASWNFERQQHMGYAFAMAPLLNKLYKHDKKKKTEAAERSLEFFNSSPPLTPFIMGIAASMEEKNANTDDDFDTHGITAIKTALMGPLAGIGDSLFWGTLLVIAIGIGTSFAAQGNIMGPILFLLIFNIPNFLLRYLGVTKGYQIGAKLLGNIQNSGIMATLMHAATVVGLVVIGGMSGSMVSVKVAGQVGQGKAITTIQSMLDSILPNMLSLAVVFLIYWLLKKGVKTSYLLLGIFIFGIIAAFFGILKV